MLESDDCQVVREYRRERLNRIRVRTGTASGVLFAWVVSRFATPLTEKALYGLAATALLCFGSIGRWLWLRKHEESEDWSLDMQLTGGLVIALFVAAPLTDLLTH